MAVTVKGSDGNLVTAHPSEFFKLGIDPWVLICDRIPIFFHYDNANSLVFDIIPIDGDGKPCNSK